MPYVVLVHVSVAAVKNQKYGGEIPGKLNNFYQFILSPGANVVQMAKKGKRTPYGCRSLHSGIVYGCSCKSRGGGFCTEARTCYSPCQLLGWEAGELKDRSIGHFEERTARQLDVIWLQVVRSDTQQYHAQKQQQYHAQLVLRERWQVCAGRSLRRTSRFKPVLSRALLGQEGLAARGESACCEEVQLLSMCFHGS